MYNSFLRKAPLEEIEDNEIVKFIEIGVPVYCIDMVGDSWAIDEEKGIRIVEDILDGRNED